MNQIKTDHILFLELEPYDSGGEKVRGISVVIGDYQQKAGSSKACEKLGKGDISQQGR